MPKTGHHHVLNGASLAVSEFYFNLFWTGWRFGSFSFGFRSRLRWSSGFGSWLWLDWLAVPFRITKMKIRFYEIVDRKIIFPIVEARTAPDDLFEFDH